MFWDFWIEEFDEKLLIDLGFKGACMFGESKSKKIQILKGEKVTAKNPNELKKAAKLKADFVMLDKSNEKVQKMAVKRCLVDGIHSFVKYPLIKEMAEKNIAVVISFNDLLNSKEPQKTIAKMKRTISLAKKYKTPIIIVSGAKTKWELRGASELITFGEVLGLQRNSAKKALFDFQEKIAKRQKLKKEGKYVMPGVEIVEKTI